MSAHNHHHEHQKATVHDLDSRRVDRREIDRKRTALLHILTLAAGMLAGATLVYFLVK